MNSKSAIEVSLLLPVYQEKRFITKCLDSILSNDYPRHKMEAILIDGGSTDGTLETIQNYDWRGMRYVLLHNPRKYVSFALNMGIQKASGRYLLRMDVHTFYHESYIKTCCRVLRETRADNAGGPMRAVYRSPLQRAVALATSSKIGVGNSSFHFKDYEGPCQSVYLGAFPRETFRKFGLFDPELIRNQDDEMNYRIVKQGGLIYQSPHIISHYYPRDSLVSLFRQYYQYGFWKVRVLQKLGRLISWRHLAPAALISGFILALVAGWILGKVWIPVSFTCFYLSILTTGGVGICRENKFRNLPLLILVLSTLHTAYGIGFIHGLTRFGIPSSSLKNA